MMTNFALAAALSPFLPAGAVAGPAQTMSFTGFVADEACAGTDEAASADHRECAAGCLARGERVALATETGFHLLDLAPEAAMEVLGVEVTVTGTLDEDTNTIAVSGIAARTEPDPSAASER